MKYIKLLFLILIYILFTFNISIATSTLTEPIIATGAPQWFPQQCQGNPSTIVFGPRISCPIYGNCRFETDTNLNCIDELYFYPDLLNPVVKSATPYNLEYKYLCACAGNCTSTCTPCVPSRPDDYNCIGCYNSSTSTYEYCLHPFTDSCPADMGDCIPCGTDTDPTVCLDCFYPNPPDDEGNPTPPTERHCSICSPNASRNNSCIQQKQAYYETRQYGGDNVTVPNSNGYLNNVSCSNKNPSANSWSGPPTYARYFFGPAFDNTHYAIVYMYVKNLNFDSKSDPTFTNTYTQNASGEIKIILTSTATLFGDITLSDGNFTWSTFQSPVVNPTTKTCTDSQIGTFATTSYAKLWDESNLGRWNSFYFSYLLSDFNLGTPKRTINYLLVRDSFLVQLEKSFDSIEQICASSSDFNCLHHILIPIISGEPIYGDGTFFLTETPLP